MQRPVLAIILCTSLLLSACSGVQSVHTPAMVTATTTLQQRPFSAQTEPCQATFERHQTDHYTQSSAVGSYVYTSNGSGLAIGDLNDDGLPDIALGNLAGTVSVLINQGNWQFTTIPTTLDDVRALAIVDTDGNGTRELVATRRMSRPVIGSFAGSSISFVPMPDVYTAFYTMGWHDLNDDGLLDVVLATYDTEQLQQQGLIFTQRGGGGVFVYYRTTDGHYQGERLNHGADALAIAFPDINGDRVADIMVGNDFNRPDGVWLRHAQDWQAVAPFQQTTENTMGLDVADIDNDGIAEIFATDMKPYQRDVATMAQWLPAMARLTRPLSADDPQYPENTLQRWDGQAWRNVAYDLEIDASGWSWSGKFGDLDNDGWSDLYVVNGMIAKDMLDYLPDNELKEADMLFQNQQGRRFTPVDWGLSNTGSGRAMSMADLDDDGDLDVVVNPLDGYAQLYENRNCASNRVSVTLVDETSPNGDAIGATVTLERDDQILVRSVKAISGYLSGDLHTVHFGVGADQSITKLVVTWPDGSVSTHTNLPVNAHIEIHKTEDVP